MFYSAQILARKGPLGTIWIAAHSRPLKRQQVFEADLQQSVDAITNPEVPLALRLSGQLLLGIVRIYGRKVGYFLHDCNDALVKVKMAQVKPGAVELDPTQTQAPEATITLPAAVDGKVIEFDLDLDLNPELAGLQFDPIENLTQGEGAGAIGGEWGAAEKLRRISANAEDIRAGLPLAGGKRLSLHQMEADVPERFDEGEYGEFTINSLASEPEALRSTAHLEPEQQLLLTPLSKIRNRTPAQLAQEDELGQLPFDAEGELGPAPDEAGLAPPGTAGGRLSAGLDDLLDLPAPEDPLPLPDVDPALGLGPPPAARGGRQVKKRKLHSDVNAQGQPATVLANSFMRERQDNWGDTLRALHPNKVWKPKSPSKRKAGKRDVLLTRPAVQGAICRELLRLYEGGRDEGEEAAAGAPPADAAHEYPETPGFPLDEMPLPDDLPLPEEGPPSAGPSDADRRKSSLSALTTTTEADEDEAPDGWSKRTRKVLTLLQGAFRGLEEPARDAVQLEAVLADRDRKDAARIFFELLVLRTKGFVDLKQPGAFADIAIGARPFLLEDEQFAA